MVVLSDGVATVQDAQVPVGGASVHLRCVAGVAPSLDRALVRGARRSTRWASAVAQGGGCCRSAFGWAAHGLGGSRAPGVLHAVRLPGIFLSHCSPGWKRFRVM